VNRKSILIKVQRDANYAV